MLSIIIITRNEEKYLPRLLKSIKKQTYEDCEIIVSDAKSTDKTRKIAKKYGCTVIDGGLPSVGRNNGAKIAKGNLLLFLDADVILPDGFLVSLVRNIRLKNIEAGSCYSKPYDGKFIDRVITNISNTLMDMVKHKWANAYGWCIFCKKSTYKKIRGFDEEIRLGEDNDFARRASKIGKFGILRFPKIRNSVRRFQREGRIKLITRYTAHQFYRLLIGEIRGRRFKYNLDYKK